MALVVGTEEAALILESLEVLYCQSLIWGETSVKSTIDSMVKGFNVIRRRGTHIGSTLRPHRPLPIPRNKPSYGLLSHIDMD